MAYEIKLKNSVGATVTVDLETEDIDYVLKQLRTYIDHYDIIKIKRVPGIDRSCVAVSLVAGSDQ